MYFLDQTTPRKGVSINTQYTSHASKNCIFSQKMQEKQMKIQNEFQNSEQFWETSLIYF